MAAGDQHYMVRALELAERGRYTTPPNPQVGCVLVKGNEVIAEGWHIRAGGGHAEVNALAALNDPAEARGATAYVSLEPCSHQGKTPPCADTLIDAGVARVVIAMKDPNPLVAGNGMSKLQAAGVEVSLLEEFETQARAINPGFVKRMESALPWVRLKLAMSLDGRTAMASGESQWITGPEARSDVQRLRARSCAVVTGVGTVLNDDAALTVRASQLGLPEAETIAERQPMRVVVDSGLRTPSSAKVLAEGGHSVVVFANDDAERQQALIETGADLLQLAGSDGRVDLRRLLETLAEAQCNEILVEAGAKLAGAFIEQELVDELYVYMAPVLMGSDARPLMTVPLATMAEKKTLQIQSIEPVGDDWRIIARPQS